MLSRDDKREGGYIPLMGTCMGHCRTWSETTVEIIQRKTHRQKNRKKDLTQVFYYWYRK